MSPPRYLLGHVKDGFIWIRVHVNVCKGTITFQQYFKRTRISIVKWNEPLCMSQRTGGFWWWHGREGQVLGVKNCAGRARPGEHSCGNSFQHEAEWGHRDKGTQGHREVLARRRGTERGVNMRSEWVLMDILKPDLQVILNLSGS